MAEAVNKAVNAASGALSGLGKAFKATSDFVGKYATIGGLLLFPFFATAAWGAVAAAAATGQAATVGGILTSFWSPLITDPVTGAMGIGEGLTRMFNGAAALGDAGMQMVNAGANAIGGGTPIMESLSHAWSSPLTP